MTTFKMPPDLPLALCYDPGLANGWAMTSLPKREWFQAGEGPIEEVADLTEGVLYALSHASRSKTVMIIEAFTVASRPLGPSRTVTVTSESIGILKRIASKFGIKVSMRQPNERTIITAGHLRGLGWHPRGKDHATQAARHLVSWLLTEGYTRVEIPD